MRTVTRFCDIVGPSVTAAITSSYYALLLFVYQSRFKPLISNFIDISQQKRKHYLYVDKRRKKYIKLPKCSSFILRQFS